MKKHLLEAGRKVVGNFLQFSIANYVGNIGCYGDITFAVNSFYMLTPNNYSISTKNKIEKFENIGSEPYSEFTRKELRNISLSFKLIKGLVPIQETINRLYEMNENGEHYPLIIASKPLGEHDYIITNVNLQIVHADAFGEAEVVDITITFEEYIERIIRREEIASTLKNETFVYSEAEYTNKEKEYSEAEKKFYKNNGGS